MYQLFLKLVLQFIKSCILVMFHVKH